MRTIFGKKAISRLAAIALALSVVAPAATVTTSVAAGAKAPKLSETSKALEAGDGFTLMVDPNGVKVLTGLKPEVIRRTEHRSTTSLS